ncbi:MAG: hypothetical protein ACM3PX_11815 [Omnitrophica WOR_2 bacterium]|jgi:ribosomal protein L44E
MKVKGTFALTCNECKKKHTFSDEEGDFDIAGKEKKGNDTQISHEMAFDFNCDRCGTLIDVDYTVTEFPEGVIESKKVKIKGGTLISEYEF